MLRDPLSDVLRLTDVHSVMSGGLSATGAWALRFPPPETIKFFAQVQGGCWLWFDDDARPIRLETGDVILLAAARGFVLASDPDLPPIDSALLYAQGSDNFASLGDGQGEQAPAILMGGHVRLHPAHEGLVLDVLPPLIHVHGASPEARAVQWIIEQLVMEQEGRPGAALAGSQLAMLLFVQVLRAYLATGASLRGSWLRAAADPRIAPALRLMHEQPGRAWRLEELARAAAMSRTTFASHFREVAGDAPLTYLARWRMRQAESALRRADVPVAVLAQRLGYASESAFSHAFKRIVGVSPKHYATRHRTAIEAGRDAAEA